MAPLSFVAQRGIQRSGLSLLSAQHVGRRWTGIVGPVEFLSERADCEFARLAGCDVGLLRVDGLWLSALIQQTFSGL